MPGDLANKVAVVTGGARGIGAATAVELARCGADVAICDMRPETEAEDVLRQIRDFGSRALFCQGDVADRAAMERTIEDTVNRLGRVHIMVNNAAQNIRKPLLELDTADVKRVFNTIVFGAFHCSQLAARRMVEQGEGGNIVTISSVHAFRPFPNCGPYNGAKAAVNQMAATWANELARYGIRVNVIEPGWIDTPGEHDFYSEEELREAAQALPFRRLGKPSEIAAAVRFLVSGDGSYITGAVLRVDGGIVLTQ